MSLSNLFSSHFACAGLLAIASTALGGCVATVQAEPAVVDADTEVVVDTVPVNIETYPRYSYEGRVVYLVDGRWVYRSGPRWVTYRREPVELGRRRVERHHHRDVVVPAYRR